MKILEVVDVSYWAIGKLAKAIKDKNPHLDMRIIEIPPKELRQNYEAFVGMFEETIKQFNPDIIHFHYWDVANTLSKLPVCKNRKTILTHHNQKNLLTHKWEDISQLVVHTQKAKDILSEAGYWNVEVIQHGIDIEKFKFREKQEGDEKREFKIGYVGRIVPWKGLVEILQVAKEFDKKVILMGRIDKPDYWQKCMDYRDQMDIRFDTPNEKQIGVYHEMSVYIGNSDDNIEEGTLPLLEAMACGIPVITTPSGEAKDIIKDGENGILVEFNNYESLKKGFERFLKMTPKEINTMRENAWNTVKNMSEEVMARRYERLYYRVLFGKDLVSVIIPTHNRKETITKIIDAYAAQSYAPIEIVIVDDNSNDGTKEEIFEHCKKYSVPVKYFNTFFEGYGLAMARNIGIFESAGHYLIISDDRMMPERVAVEAFIERLKALKDKGVVWGDKGAGKRDFIENFFAIRKSDLVNAGMFNERIDKYGGQSQEIRERFRKLGYNLQFEPSAKANVLFGTHNKTNKRYDIFKMKLKLWRLRN